MKATAIAPAMQYARLPPYAAAYSVSGEYMMLGAAANGSFLDGDGAILEILTSIKRAGVDINHHLLRQALSQAAQRRITPRRPRRSGFPAKP